MDKDCRMKWLPLLWAALRRQPARSILTLLSIAIAFLLIGAMTGVNARFSDIIERAPIERVVVSPRFGGRMPLAHMTQIEGLDGVAHASLSAVLQGSYQKRENGFFAVMTDAHTVAVHPDANITSDQFRRLEAVRNGVIMTRTAADEFRFKIGDTFPLETDRPNKEGSRAWTFRVVDIVPETEQFPARLLAGNFIYLNEGRADGRQDQIDRIDLLVSDAGRADAMATQIEKLFASSSSPVNALPERTLIAQSLEGVLNMQFLVITVCGAALFMILLLTGTVLGQSAHERVAEFAVMKAIGFSDGGVYALILIEAMVLCLAGAGLGLLAAKFSPMLAAAFLPDLPTPLITAGVAAIALALAGAVALVSGLPAAWRVQRVEIAEALGSGR
jgi:putative ABC transport system permease protein